MSTNFNWYITTLNILYSMFFCEIYTDYANRHILKKDHIYYKFFLLETSNQINLNLVGMVLGWFPFRELHKDYFIRIFF